MKKCVLALLIATLPMAVTAQETVPLFEDIPTYKQSVKESEKPQNPVTTHVNQTITTSDSRPAIGNTKTVERPRLGRDAEPLTSLVIAPFPNTTIEIDSSNRKIQDKIKNKQFEEKGIAESDLIKRDTPLNMTESERTMSRQVMDEKVRASALNRHDVSQFKLAGIGFGMDTETIYEELSEIGYTLKRVEKTIPLFRASYYDDLCRKNNKLNVLSQIRQCILEYAENDEVHYVFRETYVRPQSRETVQVSYSSPASHNVSYKIVYKNEGDSSLNSSRKNVAKKMRRQEDFWNLVFDTYGLPDENDKLLWGDGDTVYMQALMRGSAYDAYIIMEDRLIQDKDYEAAQNDFKTLRKPTAFTIDGGIPEEDDEDLE